MTNICEIGFLEKKEKKKSICKNFKSIVKIHQFTLVFQLNPTAHPPPPSKTKRKNCTLASCFSLHASRAQTFKFQLACYLLDMRSGFKFHIIKMSNFIKFVGTIDRLRGGMTIIFKNLKFRH